MISYLHGPDELSVDGVPNLRRSHRLSDESIFAVGRHSKAGHIAELVVGARVLRVVEHIQIAVAGMTCQAYGAPSSARYVSSGSREAWGAAGRLLYDFRCLIDWLGRYEVRHRRRIATVLDYIFIVILILHES